MGIRWPRVLFRTITLIAFLWLAGLGYFIMLIPSQPSTDATVTDVIVVLTGGNLRLERGFELLAQGRSTKMFISGVEDGVSLNSLMRSKEYKIFADRVNPNNIFLGHRAHTTIGNAEETAQWIAREHIGSIRLVTGNYHMPRSIYELRETMPDIPIVPEPVFPSHFANNGWWQSTANIRLVISEYHKYMASMIVHRLLVMS